MKKIKKILTFVPFYSPYVGGIVNHTEEFTRACIMANLSVTLFIPDLTTYPRQQSETNITLIYYPAFELITGFPIPKIWEKKFWQTYHSLNVRSYDCIISRTRFFPSSFLALIYSKIHHTPWIHIEHGSAHVKMSNFFVNVIARIYDALIGRLIFQMSDKVISISQDVYHFVSSYGRRDSPIIHRGLNLSEYANIPADPAMRQQYPNKILVAWTGRICYWKGLHLTLAALQLLPQELQKCFQFIIIGDGEEHIKLEQENRHLPVTFLGKQSRTKTIGLIKNTDIYIHSSLPGGGLSTSLLEAMFCYNAVIATPFEGAAEVILNNQNGILLTPEVNPQIIADKLSLLLIDKNLRNQLGTQAHCFIAKHFDWSKTIQNYINIISTL